MKASHLIILVFLKFASASLDKIDEKYSVSKSEEYDDYLYDVTCKMKVVAQFLEEKIVTLPSDLAANKRPKSTETKYKVHLEQVKCSSNDIDFFRLHWEVLRLQSNAHDIQMFFFNKKSFGYFTSIITSSGDSVSLEDVG